MTNTFAPNGFQESSSVPGLAQNFGMTNGAMAYNASACYSGDPLVLSSGKVAVASTTGNTGAAIAGIARSFKWISIAQNRVVWQNYYPGSDSVNNADVVCYFQGSPQGLFTVQVSDAGAAGSGTNKAVQADVGSFFNFYTGTGSTNSGMSGFSLDYATKNSTQGSLPFVLQAILQQPITDPTSANNLVVVGIATLTQF
jgi:hypothetical protein